MMRNERFPPSFHYHVDMLIPSLVSHITLHLSATKKDEREADIEVRRRANISLAKFIKVGGRVCVLLANINIFTATLIKS